MQLKTTTYYLALVLLSNFLFFINPAKSLAGQNFNGLSDRDQDYWYKLLHAEYFKGKSKLDGEHFFLSSEGKIHPSLELQATIEAFKDPSRTAGWFHYPVQCVFRERFAFLKRVGYLENIKETPCPMFDEWKKGLNAESATLVFSSSYPNNPSSLFGHTLIRLNQKNKTNDLLDYSVSFSAIPNNDDSGLLFAIKGMFGGYRGLIEITKYYTKVNDYTNSESRDLLEYDLNLTPEQLDRFINHVWEIYQTTYADYFFMNENCSSFLADLLAVALHDVDGINAHSHWFYLPSEMVKRLYQVQGENHLIKNFKYRPSLKKQLENKLGQLNLSELEDLNHLKSQREVPKSYRNVRVLDTLIQYLDYTRYRTKDDLSDQERNLFRSLLVTRSTFKEESQFQEKKYSEYNRPELGHGPMKWELLTRLEDDHPVLGLTFKNGYHHLMSRDLGYDPFSQFDFFTGTVIADLKNYHLTFDQLTIADLVSLHPYHFYDPQLSWNVNVGIDRYYGEGCLLCHQLSLKMIGGFSFPFQGSAVVNVMGGVFSELTGHLSRGMRLGPMLEWSTLYSYQDKLKVGLFDELRLSAIDNIKNDYQNIIGFKSSYYESVNNEWKLEYKGISQLKEFQPKVDIWQLSFGHYF